MEEAKIDWHKMWADDKSPWHLSEVNQVLVEHYDRLTDGKSGLRVLVPFAGKTVDILWLIEKGHSVVAVEFVQKAVDDFISENKLEATKMEVSSDGNSIVCYKMFDGRLLFYAANFFHMTPSLCGQIDCVYDRGALIAVAPADREKYVSTALSLVSPNTRYLVDTVDYPPEEYVFGPFCVPDNTLKALFGPRLKSIEQLASKDELAFALENKLGAKSYFFEKVHLMIMN